MHPTPATGTLAPSFTLKDQDGGKLSLENVRRHWVVLYFYPKDSTSGCTLEAEEFTAALPRLRKLGAVVLGVSPDSTESHRKFIAKKRLKLTLLSDPGHEVMEKYGVWQLKKLYGKEVVGVIRSTFVVGADGLIEKAAYNVKATGHVAKLMRDLGLS